MNEFPVEKADDEAGSSGHGGMDRVAAHAIAQDGVLGIGRTSSNEITGVEIPHDHLLISRFKMCETGIAQVLSDIAQLQVAGGVSLAAGAEQFLTRSLGHDHDSMSFFFQAFFDSGEQATWTGEREWHFWDEAKIDILTGHGGCRGNKASMPPHDFYD